MLALGIRSYHRPTRLEEALSLAAHGVAPLAGGTRLLATKRDLSSVLDLSGLALSQMELDDGDLHLGALTTLQEVMDSPLTYTATAGLLPAACRTQQASMMVRNMATLGGESIYGAHDSELLAALLVLNAVYVVTHPRGAIESPALRFIRQSAEDLRDGGLLTSLFIPGPPEGAALERVAVLPSAPSILAVAATVSFSGELCGRARIAVTGLTTPPARIVEAEAKVEGTPAREEDLERAADQVVGRAPFRDDAHAPKAYRRRIARVLTVRALSRAIGQARSGLPVRVPRCRPPLPTRPTTALPHFTSGRIELTVNGHPHRGHVEARTTLLDLLRRSGFWGVKHGCETGECGACAVLLDGRPVNACLTLALRAQGRRVDTVEGLGSQERLHPIQEAFVETGAMQCGYCTPAMELCAKALLDSIPDPSDEEVRDALAGCLCRCTGYVKPVQAVLRAAQAMRSR